MATRISQEQLNKFISPEAAMAPYERAQKDKQQRVSGEQAMEQQREEADARLAQLIQGKAIDQESVAQNFAAGDAAAKAAGLAPGKYSVQAGVGQVGYNPESEFNPYQAMRMAEAEQSGRDTRIQKYQKATEDVTDFAGSLERLEGTSKIFTDPNAELKSRSGTIGKVANATRGIPLIGSLTEKVANARAPEEAAALQGVQNMLIKESSGLGQTISEAERQQISAGMLPGADAGTVRSALQAVAAAKQRKMAQQRSILRQDDYPEASARGAIMPDALSKFLKPAGAEAPQKPGVPSFEEWKAMKRSQK